MDIVFLPDHTAGNPYQRCLANGIEDADTNVAIASGYPLDTLKTILWTRPDVIHLHWISPFIISNTLFGSLVRSVVLLIATLAAKSVGISVVWTVHNVLDHERRYPRLDLGVRTLYARIADRMLVHCPAAVDTIRDRYQVPQETHISVVPHGHYDECYPNEHSQQAARDELGVDEDAFVFLSIGQIRPYKQIPRLIEAFRDLSNEKARLIIAGKPTDPSEAERIRTASSQADRIRSDLEFIPEDAIELYLNAADVLVLPYKDILTSGSAILGMTFGNPVIGPERGCLPGLLDMQHELLYDGQVDSLRETMATAQGIDTDAIGQSNRQRVLGYDWETVSKKTRSVYEQT